ncbi:MAG: hypothetical protein KBD25_06950 [Rickettsiaceae bacterium]|nr:hypothetical protein [Rickettsiaceae bacterium]
MAIIDTHKAIEKMIAVGTNKKTAEIIVEIINSQDENLATKEDISSLKADIEKLELKLEIEFKWMRILLLTVIGLLIKVAFF